MGLIAVFKLESLQSMLHQHFKTKKCMFTVKLHQLT